MSNSTVDVARTAQKIGATMQSASEGAVQRDPPAVRNSVAVSAVDERLAVRAEYERHLHMPTRIVGESLGDHLRRGARRWVDLPDVLPLGEEGGTAWCPENQWLREDTVEPD